MSVDLPESMLTLLGWLAYSANILMWWLGAVLYMGVVTVIAHVGTHKYYRTKLKNLFIARATRLRAFLDTKSGLAIKSMVGVVAGIWFIGTAFALSGVTAPEPTTGCRDSLWPITWPAQVIPATSVFSQCEEKRQSLLREALFVQ